MRAAVAKSALAAGESTTVVTYLDTRRVSGQLEKSFFVQFDQPHPEEVRLTVKANIRDDLIVAPEALDFGRVKQGSAKDASVSVLFAGKPTKIVGVKAESEYVRAEVQHMKGEAGGASYQVSARLLPELPAGSW